jgi:hypothetical protein
MTSTILHLRVISVHTTCILHVIIDKYEDKARWILGTEEIEN